MLARNPLLLACLAGLLLAAGLLTGQAAPDALALALIPVAVVAPVQGWKQSPGAAACVVLVEHVFDRGPAGELAHYTESTLRALVPPEGWADYLKLWPEAADVVRQLEAPAATGSYDLAGTLAAAADAALSQLSAGAQAPT